MRKAACSIGPKSKWRTLLTMLTMLTMLTILTMPTVQILGRWVKRTGLLERGLPSGAGMLLRPSHLTASVYPSRRMTTSPMLIVAFELPDWLACALGSVELSWRVPWPDSQRAFSWLSPR